MRALLISLVVLLVSCFAAFAAPEAYTLTFELRISQTSNLSVTNTRVSLVAGDGEDSTFLWACKQTNDADHLVFQRHFLIFQDDSPKRGLIIQALPEPAQVFRLAFERKLKPTDWTPWQGPSYLEKGDAGATFFLPDNRAKNRSTHVPPNCFELRYKISNRNKQKGG